MTIDFASPQPADRTKEAEVGKLVKFDTELDDLMLVPLGTKTSLPPAIATTP